MKVDILAFGIVKEIVSGSTIAVAMEGESTVSKLKTELEQQYPRLKQLSSFMIAVNGAYANGETIINTGDEVAIIPPVSGG